MELTTPCIKSIYACSRNGYRWCGDPWRKGKMIGHHRLVYLLANNLVPDDIKGLVVRHKCDNPGCINPDHLELGTYQDNVNDMLTRGRANYTGRAVGSKSSMAKITEAIVKSIRHEYKTATLADIAAKYNISKSNVAFIVNKKTWKHVE